VSHANLEAASQFHLLVDQIMTTAAKHPKFETSPAATHVEAELLHVASAVVGRPLEGEHHQEGRPVIPRHEIVGRCKQLLDERGTGPIRIDELAAVAEVSQRTLRRAFNEYYGICPVRYLQLRQLHQIHRVLKASGSEETIVTDVLFAHGVSDLGRFALRYRAMFGELPSETLRAKRR
jgi:AraC family ethanolamine operon transcriptional activator